MKRRRGEEEEEAGETHLSVFRATSARCFVCLSKVINPYSLRLRSSLSLLLLIAQFNVTKF